MPHTGSPIAGRLPPGAALQGFDPYQQWLGIAPCERPVDHYRLLGVARFEGDLQKIASAADQRMALIRQQQTGPRGAFTQELLNALSTARVCLLDARSKAAYDEQLQRKTSIAPALQMQRTQPAPPVASEQPATANQTTVVDAPPVDFAADVTRNWLTICLQFVAAVLGVLIVAAAVWAAGTLLAPWRTQPRVNGGVASVSQVEAIAEPPPEESLASGETGASETRESVVVGQEATGEVHLSAPTAEIQGRTARLEARGDESVVAGWSDPNDSLSWRFNVIQPGVFQVEVTYSAKTESASGKYQILIGKEQKQAEVRAGESVTDIHYLAVRRRENSLEMRPLEICGDELLELIAIRLVPKTSALDR